MTPMQLIDAKALPKATVAHGDEPQLLEECKNAVTRRFTPANITHFYADDMPETSIATQAGGGLFGGQAPHLTYVSIFAAPATATLNTLVAIIAHTNPPDAALFIIHLPDAKKSAWFKKITADKSTTAVAVTPQPASAGAAWIRRFAKDFHVKLSADAISFLAEHTQGNLLAAKQVITKISGQRPQADAAAQVNHNADTSVGAGDEVGVDTVRAALSDGAIYTAFDFADSVLAGKATQALKIMRHLRTAGNSPEPLLLWGLSDIVNKVAAIHTTGNAPGAWGDKLNHLKNMARQLPPAAIPNFTRQLAYADRVIKGVGTGDAETALAHIAINLAAARRGIKSAKMKLPNYLPPPQTV